VLTIINVIGSILKELREPQTKLGKLYFQYKEIINYLIIGGITTVVSIVSYAGFRIFIEDFNICTVLSWIVTVLFAYVTNRIFVFESNDKNIFQELSKFIGARFLSLLCDILLMNVFVKIFRIDDRIAKIIVQFAIVVINYVLSKILVFKRKDN